MLNLNEFSHNHHPSRVNLLAKYIRRGIWVLFSMGFGVLAISNFNQTEADLRIDILKMLDAFNYLLF